MKIIILLLIAILTVACLDTSHFITNLTACTCIVWATIKIWKKWQ